MAEADGYTQLRVHGQFERQQFLAPEQTELQRQRFLDRFDELVRTIEEK